MTDHEAHHRHPLDPASAEEFDAGRAILDAAGLLGPNTRFAYFGLEEQPKHEVLAHRVGDALRRSLRALLIDVVTGELADVVVSLADRSVSSRRVVDPAVEGQFPILEQDFVRAEEIVHADEGWRAAMAKRGLTDVSKLRACPLTAGSYGFEDEKDRRMVRVLAFVQESPEDLAWAHPVDGVAAYVDLVEGRVFRLVDELDLAVPATSGNYDDPAVRGPERTTLKPIEITQPEGPSFTLDGTHLQWQGWSLRVGFDAREGLSLHQISFFDRPVVYRASVPEMVVPYGDPGPTRYWQNYFDSGEYLVGKLANSLELGCDCLGEIRYLDATVTDDHGQPRTIGNAICVHEEDFGILWKHTDIFSGSAQTRRQRRVVVSFFATVGNYDYGFYWYFYLDGTIELEIKLTGILFASAYRGPEWPYATEVAPGLGAPGHQHLFSARLDMMVDGSGNTVEEIDVHGCPVGPENPYGNALTRTITPLRRESDGGRLAAPERGRTWRVLNPSSVNGLGQPVGYTLFPQAAPTLLADPASSLYGRAGFAAKHLWVTAYDPAERYSAGDFVNQHPGGAGIPAFAANDRPIEDADVVLWHTFGPTHFPRPEDWPVMPVDRCGFALKPSGFFDRNPTLDVPASTKHGGEHCHADATHA
ncbi:Amine oxidase (copper-containing) [Catenulispora acidiphila DSM 44928]|uniref:Amine oxidase n=1 Tax=Catenulispora acidiphila (strain DSM 44928 / JCM 14897 / NBRC 102108 / NRRL B-24433 / ID139908) TaxID=479433 RepID=C7PZ87_CATAD|nr:primary-amine oxidase [Catenulispora acidiphila]ACU71544.1 Amine oxidase (copper-containing) [Catenulispora acidiphila DSM 44928]